MKRTLQFMLLAAFLTCGCSGKPKEKQEASQTEAETEIEAVDSEEREPTDDEIREYGKVISVEDSGYPMFIVTVEFPERGIEASFNLNIEAVTLGAEELMALQDQYISLYYTSEMEAIVYDIYANDASIWEEDPELINDLDAFTGVLKGADSPSGDLPTAFEVTTAAGTTMAFEHFIDDKMMEVNGKEITVYYHMRGHEEITYLRASED